MSFEAFWKRRGLMDLVFVGLPGPDLAMFGRFSGLELAILGRFPDPETTLLVGIWDRIVLTVIDYIDYI